MTGTPTITILCIDDNPTDLLLTNVVLEKAGYRVRTARNGEQALRVVRSETIDLVLSDHTLRGSTGTEIAREIKQINPRILVILFSGIIEPPSGSEQCIDMFISKDVGPEQMLEKIASLVGL